MKYLLLILIFIIQCAQAQSFYPLSVGNQWYYDSSASLTVKVVSDSLFSNGKIYSILNRNDFAHGKYVRVDSQFVYYYVPSKSQEYPIFKLNGKIDDTTSFIHPPFMYSKVISFHTITLFGETTSVIKYRFDGLAVSEFTLSDKFGIIYIADYGDPPGPWPNYVYNLTGCIINGQKYGHTTSVKSKVSSNNDFRLAQNYPNPFNSVTTIEFSIKQTEFVKLIILDCLGREVSSIVSEILTPGNHSVKWNAEKLASGIYYYRLTMGNKAETKRLNYLR